MSNASRIRRSVILGALACALLGPTAGGVAAAQPSDDAAIEQALAQERYYDPDTEHKPDTSARLITLGAGLPRVPAAQAQERYYSTYGEPEPIAAATAPEPANGTPWLTIALAAAVALAAASIAAIHRRRLRVRGRVARATT
jgi:hypothetical protein